MPDTLRWAVRTITALTLIVAPWVAAFADQSFTIPAGTIIPLRMDTYLSSESSRIGDRFTATVFRDVRMYGRAVVPTGSKIEGRVTGATRAGQSVKAGTIAVGFDKLIFPSGSSLTIDGTLTTLNDRLRVNLLNHTLVEGSSQKRRAIVFIGGAGALIAAVDAGPGAAAVAPASGDVVSTVGALHGEGGQAEVKPGTEFGMAVERSFLVSTTSLGAAGNRVSGDSNAETEHHHHEELGTKSQSTFISPDSIRLAQMTLRDRGFYTSGIGGLMNEATRNAIRQFQADRKIAITGELDLTTSRELGTANESGIEAVEVKINTARAERVNLDSIRINAEVETEGRGWQVFTNHFVSGNTLHVYIRGVPPHSASSTGTDRKQITEIYDNTTNVSRVVFHDPRRDIAVQLPGKVSGDR